jgi:hypothetical protein
VKFFFLLCNLIHLHLSCQIDLDGVVWVIEILFNTSLCVSVKQNIYTKDMVMNKKCGRVSVNHLHLPILQAGYFCIYTLQTLVW